MMLRNLEEAQRRLEAEEACDDPLRMIPYLLENKAVRGRVVRVDSEHREMGERSRVRRPLVTLHSPDPCPIPLGRELWWSEQPDGREFEVQEITPSPEGGDLVTLKLMTGSGTATLPTIGTDACFSIHSTAERWLSRLPHDDPWTHKPSQPPAPMAPIEREGEEQV
jgi:hypothetical protein